MSLNETLTELSAAAKSVVKLSAERKANLDRTAANLSAAQSDKAALSNEISQAKVLATQILGELKL